MYVFFFVIPPPARSTLFPYTTLFRSGLAIAVALLLLSWTSVLGPLWRSGRLDTVGGVVSLVYPFGDVVVAFVAILVVRRMRAVECSELWCLLAGLGALAVADSAYFYVAEVARYASGNVLDTGWVVGFLAIAL